MIPIVIVGAGGFGREVQQLITDINLSSPDLPFEVLGWIDPKSEKTVGGLPILGDEIWASTNLSRSVRYVIAIGSAKRRKQVAAIFDESGFMPHTLIHPRALVGSDCKIGSGSILTAGTILTVNVHLGSHVLVNLNATIGHDTQVGDYCCIQPGAHLSGAVNIASTVEINTGAVILPGKHIGTHAIIGAGAVVTQDCLPHQTYVGVPARVLMTSPPTVD